MRVVQVLVVTPGWQEAQYMEGLGVRGWEGSASLMR